MCLLGNWFCTLGSEHVFSYSGAILESEGSLTRRGTSMIIPGEGLTSVAVCSIFIKCRYVPLKALGGMRSEAVYNLAKHASAAGRSWTWLSCPPVYCAEGISVHSQNWTRTKFRRNNVNCRHRHLLCQVFRVGCSAVCLEWVFLTISSFQKPNVTSSRFFFLRYFWTQYHRELTKPSRWDFVCLLVQTIHSFSLVSQTNTPAPAQYYFYLHE